MRMFIQFANPCLALMVAIAFLITGKASFANEASRVVSINLCADQMAIMLAKPSRLLSVSWLARDASSSAMAREAQAYDINRGQIEEIMALEPDLVLIGPYTAPHILGFLESFDIQYESFGGARDLEEYYLQIERMGALLGARDQARRIIDDMREREQAIARDLDTRLSRDTPGPVAAIYGPNGYVEGASSIENVLLTKAGFDDLAAQLALDYGGFVSLEELIIHAPSLLFTPEQWPGSSRAETMLDHPALHGARGRVRLAQIPGNALSCGSPKLIDALEFMARMRMDLPSPSGVN